MRVCEHNNEFWAIEVFGQDWSSEVVALFLSRGLGAWASSLELPHDDGPSLPRNEGCVLCELRVAGLSFHCDRSASEVLLRNCHSNKSLALTVDGL